MIPVTLYANPEPGAYKLPLLKKRRYRDVEDYQFMLEVNLVDKFIEDLRKSNKKTSSLSYEQVAKFIDSRFEDGPEYYQCLLFESQKYHIDNGLELAQFMVCNGFMDYIVNYDQHGQLKLNADSILPYCTAAQSFILNEGGTLLSLTPLLSMKCIRRYQSAIKKVLDEIYRITDLEKQDQILHFYLKDEDLYVPRIYNNYLEKEPQFKVMLSAHFQKENFYNLMVATIDNAEFLEAFLFDNHGTVYVPALEAGMINKCFYVCHRWCGEGRPISDESTMQKFLEEVKVTKLARHTGKHLGCNTYVWIDFLSRNQEVEFRSYPLNLMLRYYDVAVMDNEIKPIYDSFWCFYEILMSMYAKFNENKLIRMLYHFEWRWNKAVETADEEGASEIAKGLSTLSAYIKLVGEQDVEYLEEKLALLKLVNLQELTCSVESDIRQLASNVGSVLSSKAQWSRHLESLAEFELFRKDAVISSYVKRLSDISRKLFKFVYRHGYGREGGFFVGVKMKDTGRTVKAESLLLFVQDYGAINLGVPGGGRAEFGF